jgi:hypothetical protein
MTFIFLRILAVAGASLVIAGATFAQTASPPAHVPLQKKIGAPTAKNEVVPSLFVLNSRGATLQNGKLVLTGVSPNVVVFADRPARSAGHDLTSRIVEDWASGSDNFVKDPPNATVSTFQKDGSGVLDAVVVLKNPKLEGDNLAFDVNVLEGDINGADGAAAVFIVGHPAQPMSVARTGHRGAYYAHGAAGVGTATVGAAYGASAPAAYRTYPPAAYRTSAPAAYGTSAPAAYADAPYCGHYPYPPCAEE